MKIKVGKIIDYIKYIIIFRKPVILEFNCLDLVIGNKLLFLLSWKLKDARKAIITPGHFKYKTSQGAAVITLRPGTKEVKIAFSNFWRSKNLLIPLKHISLDQQSLDLLIKDLPHLRKIALLTIPPPTQKVSLSMRSQHPSLLKFSVQINIKPKFNYQKFTQNEP